MSLALEIRKKIPDCNAEIRKKIPDCNAEIRKRIPDCNAEIRKKIPDCNARIAEKKVPMNTKFLSTGSGQRNCDAKIFFAVSSSRVAKHFVPPQSHVGFGARWSRISCS